MQAAWQHPNPAPRRLVLPRGRVLELGGRTRVMGILNLTPDSFYEPSRVSGKDAAVDRGLRMVEEGADVLDLGGESTRPGSEPVDPEEQCRRLLPVLEQLRQKWDGAISVDTTSAQVAQRAFEAGADIINDIGAARLDSEMPRMLSESGLPVVLMHMQGTPETMQIDPHYDDVVKEVGDFLVRRAGDLEEEGVSRDRILIDPGIGFGKRLEHNLRLMSRLDTFCGLGYPVVLGASRKSFLGRVLKGEPPDQLLEASLVVATLAATAGVGIIRVHDVKETSRVVNVVSAIAGAGQEAL
ncbi:MAG: dihydropteroate synthase [Acidobacteriota bacterium]